MKISVEQNGGLTGIKRKSEIDTDSLNKSEATKIEKLVKRCHLLSKHYVTTSGYPKGAADFYTYKIMIQDGPEFHVIECNEHNIEKDLKSLVAYIRKNSKKIV